jgi:hypothetical protein
MRLLTLLLFAVTLLVVAPASAADRLPDSVVQMRIVSRDTMEFVVEVTNPSDDVARFDAIGLYFVPEGKGEDTKSAEPQRLGVVTAGQIATNDSGWIDTTDVIDVAPHRSVRVKLAAYCIDSKRESPKPTTKYRLSSRRMPTALTTALAGAAHTVTSLGYNPEGARPGTTPQHYSEHSLTQLAIWRVRAQMPVALVGDTRGALE